MRIPVQKVENTPGINNKNGVNDLVPSSADNPDNPTSLIMPLKDEEIQSKSRNRLVISENKKR